MRRNKIFRWLYFLILLIPMLFVFLPMINNDTIYKTEVKQNVEVIEYGTKNKNILPFLIDISYNNIDNEIYYIKFNDLYNILNYYGYDFNNEDFSFYCVDGNENYSQFGGTLVTRNYGGNNYYGIDINRYYLSGDVFSFINDDDDDIFEGFSFDITSIFEGELYFLLDQFSVYFSNRYYYTLYYKDYIITEEILKTSIWYDFSVKMNDSFSFIGGFTEFVNDNIIDLSNNDYVFFSFTYMIYIFVISLLWLLFEFLMFIINFTHKYMERFYE